jgi:hypothetical protein
MGGEVEVRANQARNWRLVQLDSVFVGLVTASGPFLPVFLVRLGASPNEVGLLTALPALTAFALAIPFGRWLQARRNIVPFYSLFRLVAWLSYAVIAAVAAVLPASAAIPAILVVWSLASIPSTAGLVAFAVVMDGAAGPSGRFDLLGRRWAIAGTTTTIAVALGGQLLHLLPFPMNFEWLFVGVSLAGLGSYAMSHRLVIPDQTPPRSPGEPLGVRLRGLTALVRSERFFVRFELRAVVYTASLGLAMPLLPLFYVNEVAASDSWIGIIGAAQSAGGVLGYVLARRLARRRSGMALLLPALLAAALIPALLSAVAWLPAVAAFAFASGIAAATAQLALFDQLMHLLPREQAVTFNSVDQTLGNLALILAPNLAGFLAVAVGVRGGLMVTSLVGLAAFALFAAERRGAQEQREKSGIASAGPAPTAAVNVASDS